MVLARTCASVVILATIVEGCGASQVGNDNRTDTVSRSTSSTEVCGDTPNENAWVLRNGQRCGCWNGKALCRAPFPKKCFRRGLWYSKYWSLTSERPNRHPQLCTCDGDKWSCRTVPNHLWVRQPSVEFGLGSAEILPREMSEVHEYAESLKRDEQVRVKIVGIVNPGDGAGAVELAVRRANVIREIIIARGVARARLDVGVPDRISQDVPQPVSSVALRLVLEPPE